MIRGARRWVVALAAVLGVLMLAVGPASGGPSLGGVTSQLVSTPDLSGAVPQVPAPSVPDVTHAVPDVSGAVPNVTHAVPDVPGTSGGPSTRLPQTVREGIPSAGGGASGSGSGARPSTSHPSRATSRVGPSRGSSSAHGSTRAQVRAAARERRQVRAASETRLRTDVERYSGCLDALPRGEGRLLAIRAGVGRAAPASLRQAARRLHISTRRAAALERAGLRELRSAGRSGACGQGAASARRSAALGGGAASIPPLEPTVLLAARSPLTSTAKLAKRHGGSPAKESVARGSAAVGATAATGSGAAIKRAAVEATGNGASKWVAYGAGALLLVLMVGALVVAWRRRREPGAPRLAEQAGSAIVWWPATGERPEAAGPAGAEAAVAAGTAQGAGEQSQAIEPGTAETGLADPVAAEGATAEPGFADPVAAAAPAEGAADEGGYYGEDRTSGAAPHPAPRRPRGRAAIAAASAVSLGIALLRRRRR